jgi:hypothetical protein
MYKHTVRGWAVWAALCFTFTAIAFVFAIAVPIFSYLIGAHHFIFLYLEYRSLILISGITAALFASWYTYGLAGFFWLHDSYHLKGGWLAIRRKPVQASIAVLTILAGAFMCVAGTYVSIKVSTTLSSTMYNPVSHIPRQLINDAYKDGTVGKPFTC